MSKIKKKRPTEYDYSELNYDGDIKKVMKEHAESFKYFIKYLEVYAIFEGMTEKKWKKTIKKAKKLCKKLKKGDPSVYNTKEFNKAIAEDRKLVVKD